MADVLANIRIVTNGGDQAASEVSKATQALSNMTSASSGMEQQFQQRFEHIGLHIFAGQALQSIGLSGETRQAVMLLNTALKGAQEAAGISSGGLTLLITALVAVGAAVYEVIEKHKSLVQSLEKAHDATKKLIETTDANIESIHHFIAAGGKATSAQIAWLEASEKLKSALIKQQEVTDQDTIATLKNVISKEQAAAKTLSLTQTTLLLGAAMLKNIGISSASDSIIKKVSDSINAQNLALQKNKTQLEASIAELEQLRQGNSKTIGQMAKDQEEYNTLCDELRKQYQEKQQKMEDAVEKINSEGIKRQEEEQKKYTSYLTSNFASAYESILKNQQDFGDAMLSMFTSMIEKMISEVIALITVWSILDIVSGGITGSPMNPGTIGDFMGKNFKFATGGSVMADRPTLAMFGEAGPEVATFSPMSGGGTTSDSSGDGGTMVNNITVNVQGVVDQNMVQQIGKQIVTMIRGQGQINFSRA